MSGEVFSEDIVDRDVEPARIRDVGQAAEDVVGIAFALAAEHRVAVSYTHLTLPTIYSV